MGVNDCSLKAIIVADYLVDFGFWRLNILDLIKALPPYSAK